MGFWIFMLIMNLLIPLIMLGCGYGFRKSAPGEINSFYGYRTKRSMQNQETWDFAHHYFGEIWVRLGWIVLVATVFLMLLVLGKEIDTIGVFGGILCGVQCVLILISIYPTEYALKKTFDEKGIRRH